MPLAGKVKYLIYVNLNLMRVRPFTNQKRFYCVKTSLRQIGEVIPAEAFAKGGNSDEQFQDIS